MSKKLITGNILAVQLGRNETQIALVGKNSQILHGITVPTPAGAVEDGMIQNSEDVSAMLKEALQTPEFKGVRQVVFSLCTSQVITETASTPDLPRAKMEKLIQANADMYFPVDVWDYRLIWEVVGPKKNDAGVKEVALQLWAVPNEMLKRYYQAANACGLSVAAIDYCGHSAATAVGATFACPAKHSKAKSAAAPGAPKEPKPKKKIDWNAEITFGKKKKPEPEIAEPEQSGARIVPQTQLHILMDSELLGLTFVQEGQVVYQRFYRCGADPSYQFSELAMMVEYFQTQEMGRGSEIRGFVSGPGSADAHMVALLGSMLGMSLDPSLPDQDPRWLLCAGASETTLEFGNPSFNTTVRVRRQINTDLWQYAAILASGVALLAMILMLLNARLGWNSEIAELENNRDTLQRQLDKVSGFKLNYVEYLEEYSDYSNDWDNLFQYLRSDNDNLVLVLKELEKILPENTAVTQLEIASDSLQVSLACENKEQAAYLIMALRDMPYVDVLDISDLTGGGNGAATGYDVDSTKSVESETPPEEGSSVQTGAEPQTAEIVNTTEEVTGGETGNTEPSETTPYSPELNDLKELEEKYGRNPVTKESHTELAIFKGNHNPSVAQRQKAIEELLYTNPMIAKSFILMLVADKVGNDYVYSTLETEGVIKGITMPENYKVAKEGILKDAVTVLIKEENLQATEDFLCAQYEHKDISYNMKIAYIHYLEAVMGMWNAPTEGQHPFEGYCPYLNEEVIDTSTPAGEWLYNETKDDVRPDTGDISCDTCNGTPPTTQPDDKNESEDNSDMAIMLGVQLNKYIMTGKADIEELEPVFEKYLETLTLPDEYKDKTEDVEKYIRDGGIDKGLQQVFYNYHKNGYDPVSKAMKVLRDNFLNFATVNNDAWDEALLDANNAALKAIAAEKDKEITSLKDQLDKAKKGEQSASTPTPEPTDTRIHFSVLLGYNEELRENELDRKGLNKSDKIEPLEVE